MSSACCLLERPLRRYRKIYVDAERPATLNNGSVLIDCLTLQEAAIAWDKLTAKQKRRATIKVFGGPLYTAAEIKRFFYGPKPA